MATTKTTRQYIEAWIPDNINKYTRCKCVFAREHPKAQSITVELPRFLFIQIMNECLSGGFRLTLNEECLHNCKTARHVKCINTCASVDAYHMEYLPDIKPVNLQNRKRVAWKEYETHHRRIENSIMGAIRQQEEREWAERMYLHDKVARGLDTYDTIYSEGKHNRY